MSRIRDVLRNRNRVERAQRQRRKEELLTLRANTAYKAGLYNDLRTINMLLDSGEVEEVIITIPDKYLAKFGEALYSNDLAEYDIRQVEGSPNQFKMRYKYIQL